MPACAGPPRCGSPGGPGPWRAGRPPGRRQAEAEATQGMGRRAPGPARTLATVSRETPCVPGRSWRPGARSSGRSTGRPPARRGQVLTWTRSWDGVMRCRVKRRVSRRSTSSAMLRLVRDDAARGGSRRACPACPIRCSAEGENRAPMVDFTIVIPVQTGS